MSSNEKIHMWLCITLLGLMLMIQARVDYKQNNRLDRLEHSCR